MNKPRINIQGDKTIWMVVVFLSIFSALAVYSSTQTMAYARQGGGSVYIFKHIGIILLGLGLMYAAHLIRYPFYAKISRFLLILAILLLLYTLFLGTSINMARRWVIIPIINLTFQTSDIAKLALMVFLARSLTVHQDKLYDFKELLIRLILPIAMVCALILPSNFSTAAILFASSIVLLYIGRARIKHILMILLGSMVLMAIVIGILYTLPEENRGRLGTWTQRIETFVGARGQEQTDTRNSTTEPDDAYQIRQSQIAIASGGFFGRGPGNSLQKNYLPNPFSDFIFAIIVEEYGMAGGIFILILYLILLYRCVRITMKSPGTFGSLLAIGLGFSLVFQALINMAVTVGVLPVTGQPLPLVSMGGTSIWFTSISIGIILSVSREIEDEQKEVNHAA